MACRGRGCLSPFEQGGNAMRVVRRLPKLGQTQTSQSAQSLLCCDSKVPLVHIQIIFFLSCIYFHPEAISDTGGREAPLFSYMEIIPHPLLPPPPRPKPLPGLEERHCGPNTVLILLLGGWLRGCREIRAFSRPLC